jgi:cobalt-zinc-cadmium efflux system membrane fusion protein
MKIYIYHLFVLAFTISTIIACDNSKTTNKSVENTEDEHQFIEISTDQFQFMDMKLSKPSLHNFTKGIKTNGFIDVPPSDRVMVSAIMGGYVKISHLLVGEKVTKGQLLLTLENPTFIEIQQDFLETYETLNFLKSEYTRQKTLFDEKITSEKNYLKAESEYKKALAHFNGLAQKLSLLNINTSKVKEGVFTSTIPVYAPITGTVSKVNASVGKYMNESDVMVEIINNEHKHIELVIFEKDVLSVKENQKIKFNLPENSSEIYFGEVYLIGTAIDETNRTVKVHGHLNEEKESFLVGMFVEAEIVTDEVEKLALPIEAVLEENNQSFIMVLSSKENDMYYFEKTPVKTGLIDENWVEILNTETNLQNKEVLISGAFIPLEEGSGGHQH